MWYLIITKSNELFYWLFIFHLSISSFTFSSVSSVNKEFSGERQQLHHLFIRKRLVSNRVETNNEIDLLITFN